MVMKKNMAPKSYKIKLLRGAVGPDGENCKPGDVITCGRNLKNILVSSGRGMVVEGKAESKAEK